METKEIILAFMAFFIMYYIVGNFFVSALRYIINDLKENSNKEKSFCNNDIFSIAYKTTKLFLKVLMGFMFVFSGAMIVFFTKNLIEFIFMIF